MALGRHGPRVVDALLALAVAAAVAVAVAVADEPASRQSAIGGYLLSVTLGGLVLMRRRWPLAVLAGSVAAVLAYHTADMPAIGFMWPLSVALYSAAATGRVWAPVLAGGALITSGAAWRGLADAAPVLRVVDDAARDAVWLGLVVALGFAAHSRRRWAEATRERVRAVALEQQEASRRRTAEERLRIARDLHDVIAHTLTVVGLQLHLAAEAVDDNPREASRAIDVARRVRGEAMADLRSMIRVLRTDSATDAAGPEPPLLPAPGLADLDSVLDQARAAGLAVTRQETGDRERVPPAAGLAVHRIVQEALTNVLRHAAAHRVEVRLSYLPEDVTVEVVDDGRGGVPADGHGLAGMRERATALGGEVTAGPADGGGFRVRARIPVDAGQR